MLELFNIYSAILEIHRTILKRFWRINYPDWFVTSGGKIEQIVKKAIPHIKMLIPFCGLSNKAWNRILLWCLIASSYKPG